MSQRAQLLARVAGLVPAAVGDDCTRVGIDGGDGAGKSTFADELSVALRRAGRAVVRVSSTTSTCADLVIDDSDLDAPRIVLARQ